MYSVKFEDGEYTELISNTYTPNSIGKYTVKAVATYEEETAKLEKSFTVMSKPTDITLKLDPSSTDWTNVNLYAWDSNKTPINGSWPGTAVKIGDDGWYYATINATGAINVIWNNGTKQTVDITDIDDSQCHAIADIIDTKYNITVVDCPTAQGPSITKITYSPSPVIIDNEVSFTTVTSNFTADPTIVYSVKFEDGEYIELISNTYTPNSIGNYTVKAIATYEEETAVKEITFEAVDACPTKNWSLIGTAVGGWETDTDFVYNKEESDAATCTNVYEINNISILVGSFKIRQNHNWEGINLGYTSLTISGDADNITDEGAPDHNFKIDQETTYSKISLKSVLDSETGVETYELIFNIATEVSATEGSANVYVEGMNIYSNTPAKVINQIGKVVGNGTCVKVDTKGMYIVLQNNKYIKVLVK